MSADKKVDESWKDAVEKEKEASPQAGPGPSAPPASEGVDFMLFLSTLVLQAYIGLGDAPDPATSEKRVHLDQAKYMIDILGVIEEKTRGNLSPEESQALTQLLYELRLRYVEKTEAA